MRPSALPPRSRKAHSSVIDRILPLTFWPAAGASLFGASPSNSARIWPKSFFSSVVLRAALRGYRLRALRATGSVLSTVSGSALSAVSFRRGLALCGLDGALSFRSAGFARMDLRIDRGVFARRRSLLLELGQDLAGVLVFLLVFLIVHVVSTRLGFLRARRFADRDAWSSLSGGVCENSMPGNVSTDAGRLEFHSGVAEGRRQASPVWCRIAGRRSRSKPFHDDPGRRAHESTYPDCFSCCRSSSLRPPPARAAAPKPPLDPREVHLADLRQLSRGGENAEAYWSPDSRELIFQSTRPPYACDQIFRIPADGSRRGGPGLHRQGAHHLLLLHARRPAHPLLLDPPREPRLPAAPRPLARLRLADRPGLRDLQRQAGRHRPRAADRPTRPTTPRPPSARRTAR